MHIAIIGNGISGVTAARFIRKLSDHRITIISTETDHFFSRTALMYIYMGHMRYKDTKPYEDWFWEKNRIDLKRGYVERVDTAGKKLFFKEGDSLSYDKLILATGSTPNKFGWPGQDLKRVNGLYSYQDLEAMEQYSEGLKKAVIVGGGLIGLEMAEMFHSRHIPVTILVRENSYWSNVMPPEESAMINREINRNHIDLQLGEELSEIVDNGKGEACAVITKSGQRIECGYVGLTAGVSPNIKFLENTDIETKKGILVDKHLQTNISDIYAIGDCCEQREPRPGRRGVEAIWYAGRMMGETVAYNICEKSVAYNPGIWFNSAKFLDIEYQVYGDVRAKHPEEQLSLYWEHAEGNKSIRINYDESKNHVVGFNLMGVRFRHEVCEKWIKDKTDIETVLKDLALANFDPEFYEKHEAEVVNLYNKQSGKNLSVKPKRSWNKVFAFLKS